MHAVVGSWWNRIILCHLLGSFGYIILYIRICMSACMCGYLLHDVALVFFLFGVDAYIIEDRSCLSVILIHTTLLYVANM
jgi:hypothetical protein